MLFILDASYRKILALNERYSATSQLFYFDDLIEGDLVSGAETFTFSALLNDKTGEAIVGGNYVLINDNGRDKLFQIMISEQEVSTGSIITAYCENVGMELLNKIFRSRPLQALNLKQFLETVLSETDWEVGEIDATLIDFVTVELEGDMNIFALIQNQIQKFNAEVEFIARIENGCLLKKVNAYAKRGKLYSKRLEIEKNTNKISRKVDYTNVATALIGLGNNNIKFTDVEIEGIDKTKGQDFICDMDAYERYNLNGEHLFRIHKCDTYSEYDLLRKTNEVLKEYTTPKITYEIDACVFNDIYENDFNKLDYGDTFKITDYNFVPPLFLEARVGGIKKSKTNNTGKVTFTNFREVSSNITSYMRQVANQLEGYVDSQFPISGEKIQDDAISTPKIGNGQITNSKIDRTSVDKLLINEADIKNASITTAKIKDAAITNAKIDNAAITTAKIGDAQITNAKIGTAAIDRAKIKDGEIVSAKIGDAQITTAKIANGAITTALIGTSAIGTAQIADASITDGKIVELTASKLTAGRIDAANIEVINLNCANLTVGTINGKQIDSGAIGSEHISGGAIENGHLGQGVIESDNIKDGSITGNKIPLGAIAEEKLKLNMHMLF